MFNPPGKSTAQSSCELPEQPVTRVKAQPQQCHCPQAAPALHELFQAGVQATCSSPASCCLRARRAQGACARLAPCHGHSTSSALASQLGRGQAGVLRNSTAARLGSRGCGNTSPLLQSRLRQGRESHLPGQSSSARGSRAGPGGKEVLSRSDTCSRMETEHL